jgi:hypothetical protein
LETVYPVGAIYMSVNPTSPASLFGGTWEALKNRFLVGAGDTYAVNATGGATTHTHPLSANGHADITYFWTGSRNRLVIADHDTQGFSVLTWISEGTTSYIQFEDGSTISYRLVRKAKGYNTGPDLVDTEGNSFFNMDSDIIMYTCYDGGIMVTLWSLL